VREPGAGEEFIDQGLLFEVWFYMHSFIYPKSISVSLEFKYHIVCRDDRVVSVLKEYCPHL
jgi:hypothetical protein